MNIHLKDQEIIALLTTTFKEYERSKQSKTLYNNDLLPQSIIKLYYSRTEPAPFDEIIDNFKRKYIYNENKVENVQHRLEREGLGEVYDYIQSNEWKINGNDNIYLINELHKCLYSKVPCKEYGGAFRNLNSYLTNGGYNIADDYKLVPIHIYELSNEYDELVKLSKEIITKKELSKILCYIDKCIELKCKIIKIHPFPDGNGRTSRALLNIFFRRVDLPPTYVTLQEKAEYIKAMDQAIRLGDYTYIRQFYYYKICDSIYELDIEPRIKNEAENMKWKETEQDACNEEEEKTI